MNGRTAILLVNLGSPNAPTAPEIRRFLRPFLADRRVVNLPAWFWRPILEGIILPFRPSRFTHKYQSIWCEEGSPLLVYSQRICNELQEAFGDKVKVRLAMRYGEPCIRQAFADLLAEGYDRVVVSPMYPHYAGSTVGTIFDMVFEQLDRQVNQPAIRLIRSFCDHPAFIEACAHHIRLHWAEHGKPDTLLLSYHGLPQRYVDKGDPYKEECIRTTNAIQAALQGEGVEVMQSFQSRFGTNKWIQPYTDNTVKALAKSGVKHLQVFSPCFLADCIETLEEINIQYREHFLASGGAQFGFIPCLNDDAHWARAYATILREHLGGWVE